MRRPPDSGCDQRRRDFFKRSAALAAWGVLGVAGLRGSRAEAALTKARRDRMTPEEILALMKKGNAQFRRGVDTRGDFLAEQPGQSPAAMLLTCLDSRAPTEAILNLGRGDVFNCRVAGNIDNEDVLGSMEFACTLAGAKVVLVMGHTGCGAVKSAIDSTESLDPTGLLARIKPAVDATAYRGERSSRNPKFVDAVARHSVALTLESIRKRSPVLAELEASRTLLLVGAMHDLASGTVDFFPAV